jgi:hypothetical protein
MLLRVDAFIARLLDGSSAVEIFRDNKRSLKENLSIHREPCHIFTLGSR